MQFSLKRGIAPLLFTFAFAGTANAQNPDWPVRDATPEEMMDPSTWPDDPNYGYDVSGTGESCIGEGLRCWENRTGGQWNFWSWVPPENAEVDDWREEENALGAGTWTDRAWQMTTGDRRVVIAVLDSGINWDERDLVEQYYINVAELQAEGLDERCLPQIPEGFEGDPLDPNGDGYLSMADWTHLLDAEDAATLLEEIDDMGNDNGVAEPGDLITFCSDDVDDDGNGYVDDISGWDFHHDDNDPSDDTRFGHGTGEARWSAAAGNNGIGRIGYCPHCRVLMIRTGDSFIVDVQDFGQSVVFAVDSGARVIQEALGSINHTTYMRRALDYAYENDVITIASAGDENSFHHNYPGTANHTLYIHAIRFAGAQPQTSKSYLAFNNCTNYGAQMAMSAPGTGCSSEATAVGAGIAGLIYSAAIDEERPGGPLDPPLSAEEVRQLIIQTADDIYVPEADPDHPDYDRDYYPSSEGWDQRFGWGRINAFHSVTAVREGAIPPEVDLTNPDWFRSLYPAREGSVSLRGSIAARRAESFDYVIEWARGVEPGDDDWTTIAMGAGVTEPLEGEIATWDISGLTIENEDARPENRHTVTVRVRVTANYGGEIGTVAGVQRRAFHIIRDDTILDGFPLALGVREDSDLHPGASGESSPKLADIDGDEILEIVYGDADGLLHVINADDATEVEGFPVRLGILRGHDDDDPFNINGSAAFASGAIPNQDLASSILSTPGVADLDDDGSLEIVVVNMEGEIFVLEPDGSMREGFPIMLPEVLSADARRMGPGSRDSVVEQGAFGSPALADLDDDGSLEIVIAAFDGNVHVFREDGTIQSGFPVEIVAPQLWMDPDDAQPSRIMTSPAIGDVNGDGLLDIAVGSNEIGDDGNSGAMHLIHGDGNDHEGGPAHDNWPVTVVSLNLFPLVGRGTPSSVALADANGDGRPDLAVTGSASKILILDGIQPEREAGEDPLFLAQLNSGERGHLSNVLDPIDRPLLNTFASGSFTDLDQDGLPDFVTGGAGLKLAGNLAGGYKNEPFQHQVGAWSTQPAPGDRRLSPMMPGFPQVIDDYLFFMNPTGADVNADGYPEIVIGSAGYYLRAWDACGREAEGWPKWVGGWIIASPALGDVDGDGMLEVVTANRLGYMTVHDTDGPADGTITWPEWRHDNRNTGNFEEAVPYGEKLGADEPIECPEPPRPDAGPMDMDAGVGDDGGMMMGTDAGTTGGGDDDGCGCRVAGAPTSGTGWLWGLGVAAILAWRRRR